MVAQVSLASIMATISMVGKEQNYTTSGVLCVKDAPLRLMRIISDTGAEVSRYAKIWQSFLAFKQWANENGYKEGLTIDRIDNNGDYCPENCRWVDRKTQANNLEVTVKIKVIDTEKTLHEWADFLGINPYTLYDRLRAGWPPERALFERVSLNKYEHQKKALEAMKNE